VADPASLTGKFALQLERAIGPPSCDTLHFLSKTVSLEQFIY
jgi:hypothetical protein